MAVARKRKRQTRANADTSRLDTSKLDGRCNTKDQHRRPTQTQKHHRLLISDDTPRPKRHKSLPKERSVPVPPTPLPAPASSHPSLSLSPPSVGPVVKHGVLAQYYPRVCSLRAHLLASLPSSSRIRRKKLSSVGSHPEARPVELRLSRLLDDALVACASDGAGSQQKATKTKGRDDDDDSSRLHELRLSFSQTRKADESAVTVSNAGEGASSPQSEIVDFAIWLLFRRARLTTKDKLSSGGSKRPNEFPKNVLCHGFQRGQGPRPMDCGASTECPFPCASTIPGLFATKPSQHVQALKEAPWPQLLALLGASGEQIMADLLISHSIFLPVEAGRGNFLQVTGKPLDDLPFLSAERPPNLPAKGVDERPLSDITLVRSRIYYARPNVAAVGSVRFGLHHIHVLNRLPHRHYVNGRVIKRKAIINHTNTLHTMMYIFPRQFGLHNVFTSAIDRSKTTQKFPDYTLREEEIADKFGPIEQDGSGAKIPVPKRLRGLPVALVDKMRILHSRCSYYALLQRYCPDPAKVNQYKDTEEEPETDQISSDSMEVEESENADKEAPTGTTTEASDKTVPEPMEIDCPLEATDAAKGAAKDSIEDTPIEDAADTPKENTKETAKETPENVENANGRSKGTPKDMSKATPETRTETSRLLLGHTPKDTEKTSEDTAKTATAKTAVEPMNMSSLIHLATPLSRVSAFCQAVCRNVIPDDFWGTGEIQEHNRAIFLKKVDNFVRLRRFETTNLHDLLQGLKVADIAWLAPPGLADQGSKGRAKLSQTDLRKRKEIFAEFLYYVFDSFLIPLVRSHFYVTESNVYRNRLFFFRHDVWRRIAEPALADLKINMFAEVKQKEALQLLSTRDLGYGQVRLLPKQTSMRPIVNLRRRGPKQGAGDGRLTASINTILAPVQTMLKLEMKEHPERLGSSLFSLSGVYARLKEFKQQHKGRKGQTFYFAKVDVKSAFDTIPQQAMVDLICQLPTHERYHVDKYAEVGAPKKEALRAVPSRHWQFVAKPGTDGSGFYDSVENDFGRKRNNTVFVDKAFRRTWEAELLVSLAATHIRQNLVKIGKKFYRQKKGIPQGSVLSSLLCNYFYADLEAKELSFLRGEENKDDKGEDEAGEENEERKNKTGETSKDKDHLLLRLIDDFLLITTNRDKAARFVEVMQRGQPRYGVTVNPAKSLVNFDLQVDRAAVPRLQSGALFPYCGTLINCATLDITRDRTSKDQSVFNSLTVEYSRTPGYHFKRKVFGFLKTQSQFMFFDTSHNSMRTTLQNLQGAFAETATKMWAYARCLPKGRRPSAQLTIATIHELANTGYSMLLASNKKRAESVGSSESTSNGDGSNSNNGTSKKAPVSINRTQLTWLVLHAFLQVLRRKQTGYVEVVRWLRLEIQQLKGRKDLRLPRQFMEM